MSYVNLPGVDLWYEDTGGDGIPVIFLHAATGTTDCWIHQLPAFTAAGYRCIAYDRRTWGRSRPTDDALQPGYQGDDLHGLVEHLGLEPCHLGGHRCRRHHRNRLRAVAPGACAQSDGSQHHRRRTGRGILWRCRHRMRPPEIQNLPEHLRELGPSYRGSQTRKVRSAGWRLNTPVGLTEGCRRNHSGNRSPMRDWQLCGCPRWCCRARPTSLRLRC